VKCEQQKLIPVIYQGTIVGDYFADILVEGQVILEIKAAKAIDVSHQAQLLNYLKATGIHRGLIQFWDGKIRVRTYGVLIYICVYLCASVVY
jgi:GxxExxY protein